MSEVFKAEYIEISIPVFERITGILPFDIYIRRAEGKYTRLFPRGENLDVERLKSYRDEKGVVSLFVHNSDYRQYMLYVERVANSLFPKSKTMPAEEMVPIVKEMVDLTMLEIIVDMHVDSASVQHASMMVKACIDMLAQDPKSLVKILRMLSAHPYMIKHSIATSMFSLLLARLEKLESEKNLISVGLGSLLHDLGMTQIPFDAEDKEDLSPEEWKEVRKHPELGKRLIDNVKAASQEARMIVLQHHEQINGHGYPNGLVGRNIYYPAKIVSIADSFSALVSKRTFRSAFSPSKALEIMHEDRGKFDHEILKRFSQLFIHVKDN